MASTLEKEEGPRAFARFVEQVAEGDMHSELSGEMHELMARLAQHAHTVCGTAKGALTLKLNFAVNEKGAVDVVYDITTKEPKRTRTKGTMWLTKGNNLTVENPRQQALPGVRDVSRKTEVIDDVTGDTSGRKGAINEY